MQWKQFFKRLWARINKHEIFDRAAQLSYYFLLALFPLLLFMMTLLGYFAGESMEVRDKLLSYLSRVMPYSAIDLVQTTLTEITQARSGSKLSLGLLAALWAASNGMGAISDTLNGAYGVEETRPWWKVRLTAVALTIALSVLIILALVIVLYGGGIGEKLAAYLGLGGAFTVVWKVLQWPLALFFLLVTFTMMYHFGPNVRPKRCQWWAWGTLVAIVLWLLFSFAFRVYLHFFNSYGVTYGSLGALIILMLWFYFTGVSILIGGEINSMFEERAKAKGEACDWK
ncbi:MAG TPA: YihY/virulence factor BrkB family protein [Pyrinomonadaceae bacterium]|nr:YihY/virulence factor BrkB family protein [Pyrinomonadaceae bacterium]